VPPGVVGEIYIGGAGVARGYLNHPELTAEQFVPNPFSAEPGARLYRTGNQACWMSDGSVKRIVREERAGGGRVEAEELCELERVLLGHAGVKEAVVLALERPQARRGRVAYVVGQEPTEGLVAQLKEHVRSQPRFCALPEEWVVLESLPRTVNGKLDRHALPAPEGGVHAQRQYEEPQGELERALAQIWSDLLGVERVGRQDHFFELGGHSLMAVQLMERMRSQGLYADIRTLFMQPTLMGFAANTEKVKEVVL